VSSRARLTLGLPAFARVGGRVGSASGFGDRVLFVLCALAGVLVLLILVDVVYQLITNANPAISRFGLGFLTHTRWAVNFNVEGAGALLFGTAVTSVLALAVAAPLGVGIGIYLAMIAPPGMRATVGPVIEMLAAVPSIIFGFWGFFVLVPFLQHLEPGLHSVLGFIPLFGSPQPVGISVFAAVVVLTLMILPIISSLSRDLFLTVPLELKEGAEALGATRWEVIRGVVLPTTVSGVTAASVLALGRALGEAIAVSLVIGDVAQIHASLFAPSSTLAERIAVQFPARINGIQTGALFYAATLLLVISLVTSLVARGITARFGAQRVLAQ